jgi:MFS family permease
MTRRTVTEADSPYESPRSVSEAAVEQNGRHACWRAGIMTAVTFTGCLAIGLLFVFVANMSAHKKMTGAGIPAGMAAELGIGFPVGDFFAFAIWSVGLALLVSVVSGFTSSWLRSHVASYVKFISVGSIGAATGIIWSTIVASILGQWIGAFSFPVLYCWIGGAVLGSCSQVLIASGRRDNRRGL